VKNVLIQVVQLVQEMENIVYNAKMDLQDIIQVVEEIAKIPF